MDQAGRTKTTLLDYLWDRVATIRAVVQPSEGVRHHKCIGLEAADIRVHLTNGD